MSLWQFTAAVRGYNKAQRGGQEKPNAPTEEQFDAMLAEYERRHGKGAGLGN
jgi:hypothetical protein